MARPDKRASGEMRAVTIQPNLYRQNDVLVSFGATRVYCYASLEERVPGWLVGAGQGWLNAEYNMLPSAGAPRQQRERPYPSGRTHEIQRLVGRSLRAALNMQNLPSLTLHIDCDVIVADGGTRTASITGGMVAMANLLHTERHRFQRPLLKCLVAAVSVGVVNHDVVLDLSYTEDRDAQVDANFVGLSTGGFAEVQATNEHGAFSREQLEAMLALAEPALAQLFALQRQHIKQDIP
jgi:ribonuclease PH